jgi:hypothetical protein
LVVASKQSSPTIPAPALTGSAAEAETLAELAGEIFAEAEEGSWAERATAFVRANNIGSKS